jgi:hypothetical protein
MPVRSVAVSDWRLPTKGELLAFIENLRKPTKASARFGTVLAIRSSITTLDMYSYLNARFGKPNGPQSFMRANDSDNIVHWDYFLKIDDIDIYITGMSREIHVSCKELLKDGDWHDLIANLKGDFGAHGKAKSEFQKNLQEWNVFPNQYSAIADICADHHHKIDDLTALFETASADPTIKSQTAAIRQAKRLSSASAELFTSCIQLSLLTPILFESFANLLIFLTAKPELRNDSRNFEAYIRDNIDRKISELSVRCDHFIKPIDKNSDAFKKWNTVMNKRNNAIHGNVDPMRQSIEVVYFDGTIPLYREGGDHMVNFFKSLERQHKPRQVIEDYENTHAFIAEIIGSLDPRVQKEIQIMLDDPYPGYDAKRNKPGHLFPKRLVTAYFGTRYDDQLKPKTA